MQNIHQFIRIWTIKISKGRRDWIEIQKSNTLSDDNEKMIMNLKMVQIWRYLKCDVHKEIKI